MSKRVQPGLPSVLWLFMVVLLTSRPALAGGGGEGEGLGLVAAIGLAIVAASLLTVICNRLRLPALLGYIVAGLLLSTTAAPLLGESISVMEDVSHLGLVFLLFIIGLEMDLKGIVQLGRRTGLAVLLQAPIAIAGLLALQYGALALGIRIPGLGSHASSFFYFAVACSLGSTAVVVKLLADKFDLDSKAGRITVLTLIAEDIWAVLALSYVASTTGGESLSVALMLGGGVAVTAALVLFARYVLSRVMEMLAKSPDIMALTAIGWCFLCAQSLSLVGLSAEMGALIAGLTIGALPNHLEVQARVSSLRDFFMALFFVALGMTLPIPTPHVLVQAAALVVVVVLSRKLLFMPTLLYARLGPIVSLVAPINLAQVSEFTLLLVPLGIAGGALTMEEGAIISYGLMLSVTLSSFTIANNYRLANLLGNLFPERSFSSPDQLPLTSHAEQLDSPAHGGGHGGGFEVVMLGFFHNAEALAEELKRRDPELLARTLVIDYNLQNHSRIKNHGFHVVYGDISNPETLRHQGLAGARVVISTISNAFLRGTSNQALSDIVRAVNPAIRYIATADDEQSAAELLQRGVFRVVVPPVNTAPAFLQALGEALKKE